jgi:BirA family transcriptional regulator, biotin operon repressor / biotin---[acetyl-CoA-carboxylase] ligase
MRLDPAAEGFRLSPHDTLPSTNTEALALARSGETGPLWVTARQQTAGRGRRGNAWISTPGNLYATLLLYDPATPENAPELSFVAALAVYDAIIEQAFTLPAELALKWPNDILFGNAKLAGILIESETIATRLAVAVGIGVNCMHHPVETAYPATDLATAGVAVSAEDLFFALSGTMARRLAQWHSGAGFQSIRADWLDRAAGLGGEMRVRLPKNREFVGRAEALDERGRLLLRIADGTLQTITAGDVFPVAASGRN